MAGRKDPFSKKNNPGRVFTKSPSGNAFGTSGRPFDKQGRLADLVRSISGQKQPFTRRKNGGAVMKARGGTFKGTF
jgi:hypothetical protein